MDELIHIDGSYGEGGGQIIRTSLSLSALTGKPVEIANVRANRSKPGLQPQHLTAVQAAARICNAALVDAAVGSRKFTFRPSSPVQPGHYHFDIGTAGATPLVLQTALIPLAHVSAGHSAVTSPGPPSRGESAVTSPGPSSRGESYITVIGGTHVPHAPTAQYLEHVYLEVLRAHGLNATIASPAAGFYPRGGGRLEATVEASTLTPVDLTERGRLRSLTVYVVTSGLPPHVAERGGAESVKQLSGYKKPSIVSLDLPSNGQGASVVIVAECENARAGFSAIGERGKPMERVVDDACSQFIAWYRTGAACDEHLADQLVLPMALAGGTSRWTTSTVTEHLRTVLWLTRHFLPIDATVEEREDGTGLVTISQ